MGSFYGNIKNDQRISLVFDRIYPNRYEMEKQAGMLDSSPKDENGAVKGDGVFINRYVLINYGCKEIVNNNIQNYDYYTGEYYNKQGIVNPIFFNNLYIDVYGQKVTINTETGAQTTNEIPDFTGYHEDYHLTVWMKIYSNNREKYILVGKLKATAPAISIISDAPGLDNPHMDLYRSSDTHYVYHVPKNWDIGLNTEEEADLDTGTTTIQYPYFNQNGFNIEKSYHVSDIEVDNKLSNKIGIKIHQSGQKYPDHQFQKIILTPNTYVTDLYYYYNGNENPPPEILEENSSKVIFSTEDFDPTKTYYIQVQKLDDNENISSSVQDDRKDISFQLPMLGDSVASMYDILYGQGRNENDEIDLQGGTRPYTPSNLFNYDDIMPYNNIKPDDNISMTWAIEELKNYISELRFLGRGQGWRLLGYTTINKVDGENNDDYSKTSGDNTTHCVIQNIDYYLNAVEIKELRPFDANSGYTIPVYVGKQNENDEYDGIGLQSDWIQNDANAFGYIYHKPKMLWSGNDTSDNNNLYNFTKKNIETIISNITINTQITPALKINLFGSAYDIANDRY